MGDSTRLSHAHVMTDSAARLVLFCLNSPVNINVDTGIPDIPAFQDRLKLVGNIGCSDAAFHTSLTFEMSTSIRAKIILYVYIVYILDRLRLDWHRIERSSPFTSS